VQYHYDAWGRLVEEVFSDGTTVEHGYSNVAQQGASVPQSWFASWDAVEVRTVTDRDHGSDKPVKTALSYDPRGNVVTSTDAAGTQVDYRYGPFGVLDITQQVVPGGFQHVSRMTYDSWGRVRTQDLPDGGHHEYEHSAWGEVTEHLDPRGLVISYDYDDLGRLEGRSIQDEGEVFATAFTYDTAPGGIGRLASSVSADQHVTQYEYNLGGAAFEGLVKAKTTTIAGESFRTAFEYDSLKRLRGVVYPSVNGVEFKALNEYDDYGHLIAVRSSTEGQVAQKPVWKFAKAFEGRAVQEEELGNDLTTSTLFIEETGQVDCIISRRGPGVTSCSSPVDEAAENIDYDYYPNGALHRRFDKGLYAAAEVFEYDSLDRLTRASRGGPNGLIEDVSFAYDVRGNFLTNGNLTYTYDSANGKPDAVRRVTDLNLGVTEYEYDDAGNQQYREGPLVEGGSQTISYNGVNLPTHVAAGP
jgi:YD repeat-containing protein